jgi:two-component system sensor histidine kinase TctE
METGGDDLYSEELQSCRNAVERWRRMMADLSHDLRSPLSAIATQAELLLTSRAMEGERLRKHLDHIRRTTLRVLRIIDDVFDTAAILPRIRPLDQTPRDLALIVREAVESLVPLAVGRGRLVDVEAETCFVACQPDRIARVVWNLVDNAFKHTRDPGNVMVRVMPGPGEHRVEVHNGGPGIPPEHRAYVFERYYRGTTPAAGAGLGLSIAREIVEAHGGRMGVDTEPATCFWFTLPAYLRS